MPRVSEAHLTARREQILKAGMACFARNGFHATSMQDVIAEAGLSVGAFYRYFRSKDELIEAIAEHAMLQLVEVIHPIVITEPAPPVSEAVQRILTAAEPLLMRGTFNMALQVWAEAARSPREAALVKKVYGTLRGLLAEIAKRARDAGHLPADADPDAVASVMFSLVPGYALQHVLVGDVDQKTYTRGLETLLGGK